MIIDLQKKSILDQSGLLAADSDKEAENVVSEAFKKSKVIDEVSNSLIITEDDPCYEEESFIKEEEGEVGSKRQSQVKVETRTSIRGSVRRSSQGHIKAS